MICCTTGGLSRRRAVGAPVVMRGIGVSWGHGFRGRLPSGDVRGAPPVVESDPFGMYTSVQSWCIVLYMTTPVQTKTFRVLGRTNDVSVCGLCGREDLTHTVVLEMLDDEGNSTGDVAYLGSDCAARATGWTVRDIKRLVNAAEDALREWLRAEMSWNSAQYCAARDAWCQATYGCDIWSVRDENGKRRSSYSVVQEFDAATARQEDE